MKAVVAAFNQEKALVGAFSVITNLRMQLFEALLDTQVRLGLTVFSHLTYNIFYYDLQCSVTIFLSVSSPWFLLVFTIFIWECMSQGCPLLLVMRWWWHLRAELQAKLLRWYLAWVVEWRAVSRGGHIFGLFLQPGVYHTFQDILFSQNPKKGSCNLNSAVWQFGNNQRGIPPIWVESYNPWECCPLPLTI